MRSSGNWVELPRWQSPESSTVHVNAITMKRAVAAGADVYAVDIAMVEEAEQPSDFQKLLAATLYDAVVARDSSPATAALGRLLLPYLLPELSAFATVKDLVSHLRAGNARYCAAAPAEFLDRNQPPMFITIYFIVTRLSDSLHYVRDHFLSLDPTSLTVDLLEQHLLAAETSVVTIGVARGNPRTPFFEGMSGLLLLVRSTAAATARVAGVVEGAAGVVVGAAVEVVAAVGEVEGVGALVAAVEAAVGVAVVAAVAVVAVGLELSVEVLEEARGSGSSVGARPCHPSSFTCGKTHTQHRCFSRLDDAWRSEFGDEVERPHWAELLRSGVAIFDLDYDAILSAMYALSISAEDDCYRCVPPDPGIVAAALGASESSLPGTLPAEALHTFTLDSGASRCFFRDSTTLTPLSALVPVRQADPSGGPAVARSSTVLPCPAVPSGSLSGLHLPSFSTNLVSTAAFQDAMVTTTTLGGSSLYTLATEPPQGAVSAQVSASGPIAPPCSCRLLSHQTLLWNHRLGYPSLPCLRGMQSRLLLSSLPRSLPPLPPLPAPPCLPCVEGRQRAAPHSSLYPPTISPLQTLHMDVWGPARDLPVLLLHSDRGGEFSSDLLRDFCRGEGILQSFMLPDSPQQNGIAERRIGLVMEVARTSMIHAAAPHFLWPFTVRYAAHQLNLWPRVSFPETSPILRWTGKVGDASVFRSGVLMPLFRIRPRTSSPPALFPASSLALPLTRLASSFTTPPRAVSSLLRTSQPLPCTTSVEVAVGSGAARGAASGSAMPGGAESEVAGSGGAEPGGEESGGAELVDVEPEGPAGALPRLSPQQLREWFVRRARLWSGATGAGGAEGTAGAGGTGGTSATGPGGARTRGTGATRAGGVEGSGAGDPKEPGAAGAGGTGAGGAGAGGAGAAGTGAVDPGAGGAGDTVRPRPYFLPLLQQSASPLPAPSPYTEESGGHTERREPASRLVSPICTARRIPRSRPPPVPGTHAMVLCPSSAPLHVPLLAPPESSLPEFPTSESDRALAASPTVARLLTTTVTDLSFGSAPASALVAELLDFAAACCLDYATSLVAESESSSPPSVRGECALGTDVLDDRQEDFECLAAAVLRFASMLLAPEGDPDAPDIPTPRSYAEAITGPYSSQWQAAMDAEMASSKSTGTYVDEVPQPGANIVDGMWIFRVKRPPGSPPAFKAHYVARSFSQHQGVDYFQTFSPTPKMNTLWVLMHVAAQRDYKLHSQDFSTAFLQGILHEEIWLRRPPGFTWSTTLVALDFPPSTADPLLFLRTDTSLPPFYVLVYVDDLVFAIAETEALTLVKSELQKRHTCPDLGDLRSYLGLHFEFSSPEPTPLSTGHSLSAPPSDELVELSGPYPELVGCDIYVMTTSGMGLVLGGRGPVVLTGHADASWADDQATQRSSQGYTFSLGSGSVSWRSTRSSSVLSSSCEAEFYGRAMAAQKLRWLTYLLTNLGEQPRSPPVLYVDNKAMIALYQEHRLEHRTKHIALRYFLARELQQHGQLRLAYVATRANTADVFTKALPLGDHQRFSTMLGLVPTLPHLFTA
ncbi:unnamed protein product [Closterium sp. NIES-53]